MLSFLVHPTPMGRTTLVTAIVIGVLLTLVHAPGSGVVHAEGEQSVTLSPSKDSTLHQDSSKANGSGQYFFSGRIRQGGTSIRRGLIAFDIAGNIPTGSTIDSVTLTLQLNKTRSGSQAMTLHKVDSDWGEGASSSTGGQGANAQTNDATWVDRFFNTAPWSTAGGDFQPAASASTAVGGVQAYAWSSAQMAADAQAWLDNPSTNFGWLLKGNESTSQTVKKFHSRESSTPANRPTLLVEFTPPPPATLSVANLSVNETAGFATLTVTVDPTTSTPVSVDVVTSNGTATVGKDFGTPGVFTQVAETASFAANEATTTVTIPIIADSLDELDETFTATLTNNSADTAISSSAGSATVTILDDDPAPTVAAPVAISVAEGAGATTTTTDIIIALSATSALPVSVDYSTSDGSATVSGGDYVATSGTLTIPAGDTTGTIQATINGDDFFEANEAFTVTLSDATTTGSTVTTTQPTTTVTIVDDDPPPVLSIADLTVSETNGNANVTVSLDVPASLDVSADVTTQDGTAMSPNDYDYDATSSTVSIPAGATSVVFAVSIVENVIDEFDETFVVALTTSTAAVISPTSGSSTVTIVDNDPAPSLAISDQTANEADGTASVSVTLTGASSGGVSVEASASQGSATPGLDYASTTATLVWAPDEGGSKDLTVSLIDDNTVEGAEFVVVELDNPTTPGQSAEGVTVSDGSSILKIIDDEAPTSTTIPGITPWGLIVLTVLIAASLVWRRRRPSKLQLT